MVEYQNANVRIVAYAASCAKIGDLQSAREWLDMLDTTFNRYIIMANVVHDVYEQRESGYRQFDISAAIMAQRCDFLRTCVHNHNVWARARGLRDNGESDAPMDVVRS